MLKFVNKTCQSFIQWIGIVQQYQIVSLVNPSDLSDLDLKRFIPFCFPTDQSLPIPHSYVFRFRTSTGSSSNAFCLLDDCLTQLPGFDPNEPCAICLLSELYHFAAYQDLLKVIQSLLLRDISEIYSFLENICNSPFRNTTVPSLDSLYERKRTRDYYLREVARVNLSILSYRKLARLLIALMTDISIIVVGSNLSQVSQFCYGFVALLSPLKWDHIFIPVLPSDYVMLVQSPSPFIVGIHQQEVHELASLEIEAHFVVDLDSQTVVRKNLKTEMIWNQQLFLEAKRHSFIGLKSFMMKLLCDTLEVIPATDVKITINRLRRALSNQSSQTKHSIRTLIESRTLQPLFEAIESKRISPKFKKLLGLATKNEVTSSTIQKKEAIPSQAVPPK